MNKKHIIIKTSIVIILLAISMLFFFSPNKKNVLKLDATESDIVFNDKINIYFFWSKTCEYCAKEKEVFENMSSKYTKYYNFYGFELGDTIDNYLLKENFEIIMKQQRNGGVPFVIIGEESLRGFGTIVEKRIKEIILEQKDTDFDVYKEYLKNKEQ